MSKKKALLKNTIMLYILTFSTYIIGFILLPYETRVLQPDKFGLLGLATAVMTYFQLIIDFGFMLSATEDVASCKDDKHAISVVFTAVTIDKICLVALSTILLLFLCFIIKQWRENTAFFFLMYISTALNSFIPDYLYRGIECMESITIRTVLIKIFFAVLVLVFVKRPQDYMLIPVLNIIGNSIALIGVYVHLKYSLGIKFVFVKKSVCIEKIKESSAFFMSRIATTIYTAMNTLVLNFALGNAVTAFYTSADKLVSTAKSGMSPISDSMYPYMIKNKDFKLVKKVLMFFEPIIIVGCIVLFICAKSLCVFIFGTEYLDSAYALRALLPGVMFTLPNYILGFPVLGALGISKYANYSVVFGSIVHIFVIVFLTIVNDLNMVTLGLASSLTEGVILGFRIIVIRRKVRGFIC